MIRGCLEYRWLLISLRRVGLVYTIVGISKNNTYVYKGTPASSLNHRTMLTLSCEWVVDVMSHGSWMSSPSTAHIVSAATWTENKQKIGICMTSIFCISIRNVRSNPNINLLYFPLNFINNSRTLMIRSCSDQLSSRMNSIIIMDKDSPDKVKIKYIYMRPSSQGATLKSRLGK